MFNKSFYSQNTILEAINDFNNLCTGNLKPGENDFIVELRCKLRINNHELSIIGHEFCNYTLGLMKNKAEV